MVLDRVSRHLVDLIGLVEEWSLLADRDVLLLLSALLKQGFDGLARAAHSFLFLRADLLRALLYTVDNHLLAYLPHPLVFGRLKDPVDVVIAVDANAHGHRALVCHVLVVGALDFFSRPQGEAVVRGD